MRKPAKRVVHRGRHQRETILRSAQEGERDSLALESDGIGREGRMWKSFMRLNSVNSRSDRCAICPSVQSNAEEGVWGPFPAVTKIARRLPCRLLPGERCLSDRYRCGRDRSWLAASGDEPRFQNVLGPIVRP